MEVEGAQALDLEEDYHPMYHWLNTKRLVWRLDDLRLYFNNDTFDKFRTITDRIAHHGGTAHVLPILFRDYGSPETAEYQNITLPGDVPYYHDWHISRTVEYFNDAHIVPVFHGWNHSVWEGAVLHRDGTVHEQLEYINHTMWTYYNNFGLKLEWFLDRGFTGNWNTTEAIRQFSERNWDVSGVNFRTNQEWWYPPGEPPAIRYIGHGSYGAVDPVWNMGGDPGAACIEAFYESWLNLGADISGITFHPQPFNETNVEDAISLIDMVYEKGTFIEVNFEQAMQFVYDKEYMRIEKPSTDKFVIDFSDVDYDHEVLLNNPYGYTHQTWELTDSAGNVLDEQILRCGGLSKPEIYISLKRSILYLIYR